MRHLKAHRKLGRNAAHRRALYSNMVSSLFTYGQIETTEAKAKELRGHADRAITWAKSVGELTRKGKVADADRARIVHARRMARRVVKDEGALDLLFGEIAPRMANRAGGYTRVLKTRFRAGDAAPMALIQLVDFKVEAEAAPAPVEEKKAKKAAPEPKAKKAEKAEKAPAKKKSKKSDD